MSHRYILKDTQPQLCEDLEKWAMWYGSSSHQIASDRIGNISVSTAFIGIAMGEVDGLPILFETLVSPSGEVQRHATYQQALQGHARIVEDASGSRLEN
ncbi:hypothetical protein [Chamaesiphon minutus]|uniref:Uncharacterized protein n=1 Tax=Chamaesiphon minutus (strain ATCC 27169 / PCC 6605) TaxID=1173020 RepID=K9UDA8_CHAP6|nr:hypothetical protein [Chamaesiphon minutus]AFY93102.1 hypothetical protein Cha6605_1998 [Chamaesiphon minutus PCC 6605]